MIPEKIFGYWNNNNNQYPEYPFPKPTNEVWNKDEFLKCLDKAEQNALCRQTKGISITKGLKRNKGRHDCH